LINIFFSKSAVMSHSSTTSIFEKKPFLVLSCIFIFSLSSLIAVYVHFPKMEPSEKEHMKLPRNIDDAKRLGSVLYRYKDNHYYTVLGAIFVTYIFLQSFAIPGSIFLSILSGYLFSFYIALTLVCACSAVGASICYLLSFLLGRRVLHHYFAEKIRHWSMKVAQQRRHMLNYMIFLRITPIIPNWFINVAAPVIEVPFWPFFWGTFIGVAPPSFVAIQAGTTLQQLTSSSDGVNLYSMAILGVLALLSLAPVIWKEKLKERFD